MQCFMDDNSRSKRHTVKFICHLLIRWLFRYGRWGCGLNILSRRILHTATGFHPGAHILMTPPLVQTSHTQFSQFWPISHILTKTLTPLSDSAPSGAAAMLIHR